MNKQLQVIKITSFIIVSLFLAGIQKTYASHAMGADLTYECMGGNTYKIRVSFYRDCIGIAAPGSINVNVRSNSCGRNFGITCNPIPGTGQEVSALCPTATTTCNGGTYTGIQEWVYEGLVTLPVQCTDWTFSWTYCCRNAAITTINTPGASTFYIYATLDNTIVQCNNSPTFTNKPVPFACIGQQFQFNHGAIDIDGDSLVYSMVPPKQTSTTDVNYLTPYNAITPLTSIPALQFNNTNGDIVFTPTVMQVTVMAVLVEEYRNGVLIGSVVRDIQVTIMNCNNSLPTLTGINGTADFDTTVCANTPLCFDIYSNDIDAGQTLNITWNNGIDSGSFTSNGATHPTGYFCWTPTDANISNSPYCFTVRVNDDACPYIGSQTYSYCVTVHGVLVNAGPDQAIACSDLATVTANVITGVAPYTYLWSNGFTNPTQTVGIGTYVVTVTDAEGCQGMDTINIISAFEPTANFNYSGTCLFGPVQFTDASTSAGGSPIISWSWIFGDGATSNLQNPIHIYNSPGTYNVTLIVENLHGCIDTIIRPITIAPLPVPGFTTGISCAGSSTCFNNTTTPAGAIDSVWWNFGNGNTSQTGSPCNTYATAGNYNVTLVVQDTIGCRDTIIQPVTINPLPAASFTHSGATCQNSVISFFGSTGVGYTGWSWNFGDGDTSNLQNPIHTYLSGGTFNVSLIITNQFGCVDTFTSSIVINILPLANAGPDVAVCLGSTVTLNATGGVNYTWNPGGVTTGTISVSPSNDTTYTVIVTDINGCSAIDSVNINVQPLPVATVSPDQTICNGVSVTLTASGGVSYNWNPTGSITGTITVSPSTTTTYAVDVIDSNGCQATAFVNVIVNNNPVINLPAGVFTCNGINVTLDPGSGGTSYSWNTGATTQTISVNQQGTYSVTVTNQWGCKATNSTTLTVGGGVINNSNNVSICEGQTSTLNAGYPGSFYLWSTGAITQTITVGTAGAYQVTITNPNGCSGTIATTVNVNQLPTVNFLPNFACINQSVIFTDLSSVNGSTIVSWNWNFGDGNVSQQQNPVHTYQSSGTFTVSLTVTTSDGCSASASHVVTINSLPQANFNYNFGCQGMPLQFTDISNVNGGNITGWSWDFGDGTFSNLQNPTHAFTLTGTIQVTLTITTAGGCTDSRTHNIQIYPQPILDFTLSSTSICNGSAVSITNNSTTSNGAINSWNWNFGDGYSSSQSNPSHIYTTNGTFNITLIAVTSHGCSDTLSKPVTVSALPVANAGNNVWICRGVSTNLTASGGSSYSWSPGGNTTQVISVSPNNTTTYYVTVTNAAGCTARDSVVVTIKNLPNAIAGPDKSICIGGSTTLLAAGGISYTWNPGGISGNTITVSPVVTTQYIVTVNALNGCSNRDTVQVNVKPLPVANAGPDQTICSGFSTTLTASGGSSYYWSNNGATTSTIYVGPTTTSNYIVTVTDSNGCVNSDNVNVNVLASPVVVLNSPGFFCAGYSTSLDAGNAGSTFLWTPTGELTQSITVSTPGNYSVAVTNAAGCTAIGFADIFEGGTGLVTNSNNFQLCQGNSTVLDAANPGSTYLWSTGSTAQTISVNTTGIYNVTVTDSLGCSNQFANIVSVNPLPNAGFTGNNVCFGSPALFVDTSLQSGGNISSWSWYFGNGMLGNSATASINYAAAGSYTVSLVVTSGFGCTDSIAKNITINPLPVVNFTANTVCDRSAVQFNDLSTVSPGSVTSWSWDFGDGTTSSFHNPSYSYAGEGTYNVTLVATTAAGCSNSMINSVTVNPKPTAGFNAPEVCEGDSMLFINTSNIVNGAISDYTWDFGDGFGSTLNDPKHIYANAGTYNVILIAGSDLGCNDTVAQQVIVNSNPVADFATAPVCGNAAMLFNDLSNVAGSTVNGWSWSFGDSTISNIQDPSHIYNTSGTYLVNLTALSAKGCSDTIQKNATVHPVPRAGFAALNACTNSAIQFNDTSSVALGSINSWQWNFGDGSTSITQHPTHIYASPGTYQVKLYVGCATGCVDSITQSINVFPVPTANFASTNVCANDMTSFNDQSFVTGGGTYSYNWNFGDGSSDTMANTSHLYAAAGNYNVTLNVTTPFGCTASIVKQITVYDLPVAAFTSSDACENVFAQLSDASNISNGSIAQWSWSLGDGTSIQAQHVNHLYPAPGLYTVTLNVTSNNGCKASAVDTIEIYAKPTPAIATQSSCVNQSITLNDTGIGPNNNIINWDWTFDNGTSSIAQNPTISYTTAGIHNVSLTTTNANGCRGTTIGTMIANPLPSPGFYAGNSCAGDATQFNNTTSITSGSIGGYTWHFGDNTSVNGIVNPSHIYSQPGVYVVTLVAYSEFGCADSITQQINVHPTPVAGFVHGTIAGCGPLVVQFIDTSSVASGNIISWLWDFGDGQTSTLQNPSHTYLQSGSYMVSLTVTSDSGCSNSITVPDLVTVYPAPIADFTPKPETQSILNPIFEFQNISVGGQTYHWTLGNGNTSNEFEPSAQVYPDTGNYQVTLIVVNSYGCRDTVVKPIRVEPEFTVYIPNAFTPNNDGTNEGFNVKGWYIDNVILDIYNRWGDLIFHSEGRNNDSWMGGVLNQSELAPEGVYVYDIKVRDVWGKMHQHYGHVNLIR